MITHHGQAERGCSKEPLPYLQQASGGIIFLNEHIRSRPGDLPVKEGTSGPDRVNLVPLKSPVTYRFPSLSSAIHPGGCLMCSPRSCSQSALWAQRKLALTSHFMSTLPPFEETAHFRNPVNIRRAAVISPAMYMLLLASVSSASTLFVPEAIAQNAFSTQSLQSSLSSFKQCQPSIVST